MRLNTRSTVLIVIVSLVAGAGSIPLVGMQNQTPARPQGGQPPAGQKPAPGNQPAQKPAEPPPPAAAPLYVTPAVVQYVQLRLLSMGFPVPAINGGWGDNTSAAVAAFQRSKGLDPGGDLDEATLAALGLPQVLNGDVPADAKPVASLAAAGNGAPLSVSPQLARLVQNRLTESGFPTDNVFGIWMAGSESATRAFQKSKGLEPTGALDLRLIHTLGLTTSLLEPKPGERTRYDSVTQILDDRAHPFTGVPLAVGPAGIRQIQTALQQQGHRDVAVDGKWTDATGAALKKFQEAQKLEPTGTLNLPTLRALGFARPLADLDAK
jgi:peptidoglycan hydrolase-like protein with peptidoglycan-binding domain